MNRIKDNREFDLLREYEKCGVVVDSKEFRAGYELGLLIQKKSLAMTIKELIKGVN